MKVLITGGSSEIAQAIVARRLLAGDKITVTASSQESLDETRSLYSAHPEITVQLFNLSKPQETSVDFLQETFDAIILNAHSRTPKLRRLHEWGDEATQSYLSANIYGNIFLLQKLLPQMLAQKFGRVILLSSQTATMGTSRFGLYCATKSAMEGLFLNLAVDYGEFNILFNIVRPGVIATERTKRFWKRSFYIERMKEIIPQQKLGLPSQVAEVLDPMLSPTSYMNGSVLSVTGGLPMMRSAGILNT